ncbi:ABC transporter substrate-binding protein [Pseudaestuariivita atlantica]|uniref:ABC transporter substrate-binding protein n=1 Tax=Pseudaestuariivita atlantica TaxID=1317121 RepID=A0A0L1JLN7_9RHOB|nr:ABC transporter substrate-binding protein [Pseudaestuariivita atlantica]KNG92665.1 ABC transporter substrate-binding protein [Pseudaestuariivita atlantica]
MRYLVAVILALLALPLAAQDWEDRQVFGAGDAAVTLRIVSSTDTDLFAPLIEGFVSANPDIAIEYLVTNTSDIDKRFRATPEAFDVAISSAMDLQLKLTNDGYAATLEGVTHPAWAQWRQSLFAFTSEPAAIVVNRAAFEGLAIPRTRQELIEILRAHPDRFRGRVGTYDVRQSGLGYLFATQDARASETFWRLMEIMGGLDVALYCCSGDMIDDLIAGRIAVAYNVLGSYAEARVAGDGPLDIILPSDFRTTMMRTALVSGDSPRPEAAERFVRALIAYTPEGAAAGGGRSLPPLAVEDPGADRATIPLGPALMTFLDALKRDKFLEEWENAVVQD